MNEENSFIKSKKGQLLIVASVAGVLVIVILVVMISTIGSYFEDPLAKKNASNLNFVMELTPSEETNNGSNNKALDDYVDNANRSHKIVALKDLAFSPKKSQSSDQSNQQFMGSSMNSEDKLKLVNEVMNGESSSSFKAQQPTPRPTTIVLRPQERDVIRNEINEIYNGNPTEHSTVQASSPRKTPVTQKNTSAANRVIENAMLRNSSSVETNQEDELQSRRRRMMGSASGVNTHSEQSNNLIKCIIHGTQKVKESQTVVLRLTEELWTDDNMKIPKNTIVYGTLSRGSNDRVRILISGIKLGGNVHPLNARIYSADGQEGIRISNTEVEQQVKTEAVNQISSAARNSLSGNIVTNAVAGITTALVSGNTREKQLEVTLIENVKLYIRKSNDH